MSPPVKRRYESPLRREQAADTRRRILDAAEDCFRRDGYAATSVAAIAAAAGVSARTVYLAFETKSGVLRALWHARLRGADDAAPVGEQDWFREVLEEPDPRRAIALNMRNSRAVKVRAGGVLRVIRAAADSDAAIGALWARIQQEFHANQRAVVEAIDARGGLRDGLDVDAAADVLWGINHPAFYALLADERGWSAERYEAWATDLLCAELLRPSGRRRPR